MEYVIKLVWDAEAQVWIATSEDIPGLILESESFDALIEHTCFAVPELLALNNLQPAPFSVSFLSEPSLAKDWMSAEEELAWKDL